MKVIYVLKSIPAPTTTGTTILGSNFYSFVYLYLLQRFNFQDAYFYYKGFKLFVSTFPQYFFNQFFSAISFNQSIILFEFVKNNRDKRGQFYLNSDLSVIPDIDIYYLPLNWLTSGLVYSENACAIRAVNNNFYRIFSCGYKVMSFARGLNVPAIYSNPSPALLYDVTAGHNLPYKINPTGTAISPNSNFEVVLPTWWRELFLYYIPTATDSFVTTGSLKALAPYTQPNVYPYATPDSMGSANQPIFIDNLFMCNVTKNNTILTQNAGVLDTVLCSEHPRIGFNGGVYDPTNHMILIPYFYESLSFDTAINPANGQVIPNLGTSTLLVTMDLPSGFGSGCFVYIDYFSPNGNNPTNIGLWTLSGSSPEGIIYSSTVAWANMTVSVGQFILQWSNSSLPSSIFYLNSISPRTNVYGWNNGYVQDYYPQKIVMNTPLRTSNNAYSLSFLDQFAEMMILTSFNPFQFSGTQVYQTTSTPSVYNAAAITNLINFNYSLTIQNYYDDEPMSQVVKILRSSFQYLNYYQMKYFFKTSIIMTQLNWTNPSNDEITYVSDPISLPDKQIFEQYKQVAGVTIYDVTQQGSQGTSQISDSMTLSMSTTRTNKYGQYIPIGVQNPYYEKLIFQNYSSWTNVVFTLVCGEGVSSQIPANTTFLILYLR